LEGIGIPAASGGISTRNIPVIQSENIPSGVRGRRTVSVCAQPIPLSVRSGRNVADVQSPNSCLCSSNEGRETTPSVVSNEQIGVPSPNDPIHSIDSGRETTPSVVSNEQTVYCLFNLHPYP